MRHGQNAGTLIRVSTKNLAPGMTPGKLIGLAQGFSVNGHEKSGPEKAQEDCRSAKENDGD